MTSNGEYKFATNPSAKPYDLNGKTAIITGGGSGLGEGIAYLLASHGVNIVINGRTKEKLEKVQQNIIHNGGKCEILPGDASLEQTHKQLVDYAIQKFGSLHIALNNSGTAIPGSIVDTDSSTLNTLLDINVKGVVYGLKYQLPAISKYTSVAEPGIIINVSSTLSTLTSNNSIHFGIYGATKAFVDQITKAGAVEGGKYNVRVNAINPGYVYTDLTAGFAADSNSFDEMAGASNIAKRAGAVEEIARVTLEIIHTKFINGATLVIDGGANVY